MSESYRILSIDAWREEFGWNWNNWFNVGEITKQEFNSLKTNRATLKWFRDAGFLSDVSKGRVKIESDGYNVVVCAKSNGRPLFAIEVGE